MTTKLIGVVFLTLSTMPAKAQESKTWTLESCVNYAVEHNLTIKQQEDNVEQQRISLSTAKNSRLPDLNGSIGQNFNFGRGNSSDNVTISGNVQSTNFGLNTSVPLITGGRIPAEIKVRSLGLEAALADLSKARESVALQVISAYLEAIYQQELVEVARRQVELSEAQVHRSQLLYDNNKTSAADLAQIKAQKANDESSLVSQENNYQLALLNLSQLLELDKAEGMTLSKPTETSISGIMLPAPDIVYSEALGIKPQIAAEELRLRSAQKNVTIARSALYPSLSLSAGLSSGYYSSEYNYVPREYTDANGKKQVTMVPGDRVAFGTQLKNHFNKYIALNLSIPIFNRFQTRNNIRAAKLQVHTQEIQLEQTRKTLYKEIQQAYYNALGAQRQCSSSATALSASQESFALMKSKYENGKATPTEFQEAKTNLMKAESTAIQNRYTFLFRQKILDFYRKGVY